MIPAEYTADEMRAKIRRFGPGFDMRRHQQYWMSDAEFERRYDPEAAFRKELLQELRALRDAINRLNELPDRSERTYLPPVKTPPRGHGVIEL